MQNELTPNVENIIKVIKNCIPDLEEVEINENSELIASGLIESLDLINIIAEMEIRFDIKISIETLDITQFETPKDIFMVLKNYKAQLC